MVLVSLVKWERMVIVINGKRCSNSNLYLGWDLSHYLGRDGKEKLTCCGGKPGGWERESGKWPDFGSHDRVESGGKTAPVRPPLGPGSWKEGVLPPRDAVLLLDFSQRQTKKS